MSMLPEPTRPPRRHPWWRVVAWAAVVVLAIGGLAVIAVGVLAVSAANSYGNNK